MSYYHVYCRSYSNPRRVFVSDSFYQAKLHCDTKELCHNGVVFELGGTLEVSIDRAYVLGYRVYDKEESV